MRCSKCNNVIVARDMIEADYKKGTVFCSCKKIKVHRLDAFDDDEKRWHHVGLEMCHGDFLCKECRINPANRDVCDFIHEEVFDKQIAIDKHNSLAKEGIRSIISEKEVAIHPSTEGILANDL